MKQDKFPEKEHIMIIVPTKTRWVTESVANLFAHATKLGHKPSHPYRYTVATLGRIDGYAAVRNRAAQMFLGSDASRLWFVDNDTILPNDIFEILDIDGDIVTLPYPFVGTMTPAIVNYKNLDDFSEGMADVIPGPDGVADVNGTGLGCTVIRRRVLTDPRMRYSSIYTNYEGKEVDEADDSEAPLPIFKFHRRPSGRWDMGEDYDFCIRAKKLGYSIKIRMKSICGHLKTIDLNEAVELTLKAFAGERSDTKTYAL